MLPLCVYLLLVLNCAVYALVDRILLISVTVTLDYDPRLRRETRWEEGDIAALDTQTELKFFPSKGTTKELGYFVSKVPVKNDYAAFLKLAENDDIPPATKQLSEANLIVHLPWLITHCVEEPAFAKARAASLKCFCEYEACGYEANTGAKMFAACIAGPLLGYYTVTAGQLIKDFGLKRLLDDVMCKGMKTAKDPEEQYKVMRGIFDVFSDIVVNDDRKPLEANDQYEAMKTQRNKCIADSGLGDAKAKEFWCEQGADHPDKEVRRKAQTAYACMLTTACLTFPKQLHNLFTQIMTSYERLLDLICGNEADNQRYLRVSHTDMKRQLSANSNVFGVPQTVLFVQPYYDLMYHSLRLYSMAEFVAVEKKPVTSIIKHSRARCTGWTDGAEKWSQYMSLAFDSAVCNIGECMPPNAMAVVKDFYDCMIGDVMMWSDFDMVAIRDKFLFDKYIFEYKTVLCTKKQKTTKALNSAEFSAIYGEKEPSPSKDQFEQRLRRLASICANPQTLMVDGVYEPSAVYNVLCNGYSLATGSHVITFRFYGCIIVQLMGAYQKTRAELNKEFGMDAMLHSIVCPTAKVEAKDMPRVASVLEAKPSSIVDEKKTKADEIPEPSVDLPWSAMIEKLSKTKRYGKSGDKAIKECSRTAPPTEFNQYRFDLVYEAGRTYTDNSVQENLSVHEASRALWNMAFKRCGGNEAMISKDGLRPSQNKVCISDIELDMHSLNRRKVTAEESREILEKTKQVMECIVADATFVTGLPKDKLMAERNFYKHFTRILCHLQIDQKLLPKAQFDKMMGSKEMGDKIDLPKDAALKEKLIQFSTECLDLVSVDTPNVRTATEMSFCYDLPQTPAYQFSAFRHYGCIMFKMMYTYHQTRNDIKARVDKMLHTELFCKGRKATLTLPDNWAVKANKSPLTNPDVVYFSKTSDISLFSKQRPNPPSTIAKI